MLGSDFAPFLYSGITWASFSLFGNIPCSKDWLRRRAIGWAIKWTLCFKIIGEKSSILHFLFFNDLIIDETSEKFVLGTSISCKIRGGRYVLGSDCAAGSCFSNSEETLEKKLLKPSDISIGVVKLLFLQ